MELDDFKICAISTIVFFIIALPVIVERLLGTPITTNLTFEASILYLPLVVLLLLTWYERPRAPTLQKPA